MAILTVYNADNQPLALEVKDFTETLKYAGDDTLTLTVPMQHPLAGEIVEETVIKTQRNSYLVKIRDERGGEIELTCVLDLRDWDARYWREYPVSSMTLTERLADIKPDGWAVANTGIVTISRTIDDGNSQPVKDMTPRILLEKCSSLYGVQFNFNCINKTVYVVDPTAYQPTGKFLTDQLNLESIGLTGDSTELITRLYPYGKTITEGETSTTVDITSVNGGLAYIDDNTYTSRIIVGSWTDERYTDPQSLLNAAREKLTELAFPKRAYECDVAVLENYNRYDVITLIDRVRQTQINHQIVEIADHPNVSKTTLTLTSVPGRIETNIKQAIQIATGADQTASAALNYVNGSAEELKELLNQQSAEFEQKLTNLDDNLTNQIQEEQTRSDEVYQLKPIVGEVTLTATSLSKTVVVPYTSFFVMLTPSAKGNCWARSSPKSLTIYADTAMTVGYAVFKKGG